MKLQPFHKGRVVRITNIDNCDEEFYRKYQQMDKCWQRFFREYKHRSLYVKDYEMSDVGNFCIFLEPLPDYVDPDMPFYSDEIDGEVPHLPEELFII